MMNRLVSLGGLSYESLQVEAGKSAFFNTKSMRWPLFGMNYTGYNRPTKPIRKGGASVRVAHCWVNARRKLKEVFDRDGSEIAAEGLRRIAELYAIEADIRASRSVSVCPPVKPAPLHCRSLRLLAADTAPQDLRQSPAGRKARLHP